MAQITIIYGSCGGNTQMVCEWVADVLSQAHDVKLLRANFAQAEDMTSGDFLILGSPTYGHGDLERQMEKFLKRVGNVDLTGVNATVIGLGDLKYEPDYFMQAPKVLQKYLNTNGAKIVGNPLIISECPVDKLTTQVQDWAVKLSETLAQASQETQNQD